MNVCTKYYPQIIAGVALVTVAFFVLMRGSEIILESQRSVPFAGPHWNHKGMTVENSVLFHSQFLRLESHTIRTKTGELVNGWMWVDFTDQVNVLVQEKSGNFALIRMEKYGLPKPSLSVVTGAIALNEQPQEAAEREVLEELGMVAKDWVFLGKYRTDANRGGGFAYSFLARNAKPAKGNDKRPPSDELETQEIVRMNHHGLTMALLNGEFGEAKWSNTVALALVRLATRGAPTLSATLPLNQE